MDTANKTLSLWDVLAKTLSQPAEKANFLNPSYVSNPATLFLPQNIEVANLKGIFLDFLMISCREIEFSL